MHVLKVEDALERHDTSGLPSAINISIVHYVPADYQAEDLDIEAARAVPTISEYIPSSMRESEVTLMFSSVDVALIEPKNVLKSKQNSYF